MVTSNRHYRPPSRHADAANMFTTAVTPGAESAAPGVVATEPVPAPAPEPVPAAPVAPAPELTPAPAAAPVAIEPPVVDQAYQNYLVEQSVRKNAVENGVDPEDAVIFYKTAVAPVMQAQLDAQASLYARQVQDVTGKFTQDVTAVSAQVAEAQRAQAAMAREATNKKVLAVHPDAQKILGSKAFVEAMSKVEPYAERSNMDRLVEAYEKNDADFIIDRLQGYLQQQPDIASIAEVGQAMVATQPAASGEVEILSNAEYTRQMTELRQQKSTPEVRKKMQALADNFAAAQADGRVK